MTLAIILTGIILLVTNSVTGFFVFKGVQLGLRWQVEVRQERPPTLETPIKNPVEVIQQVRQEKEQVKQNNEINSLLDEWVNGAKE